ncbi:MAG TPA: hypothetical protein VK428_00710 [Acidimicrobiales bacterium]|nr:hypothetical protein [Acidimicrobiales bacterium]
MPFRRRLVLSVVAVLGAITTSVGAGAPGAVADGSGSRALPDGWELCLLQNLGAPATAANVADLDEWQIAEGGSTDNDYSYNPFNTMRSTDGSGNPLPASVDGRGFPSFIDWAAGCAATVATIEQPNMNLIQVALQAGGSEPASTFLSTVNETPWCAPENGQFCYATLIAERSDPPASRAIPLLDDTSSSVNAYNAQVSHIFAIQVTLAGEQQQLVVAGQAIQAALSAEQAAVVAEQAAQQKLQQLAVYDYTSNPSLDKIANLDQFEAESSSQLLTQFYEGVDSKDEVTLYDEAQAAVRAAQAAVRAAQAHAAAVQATISATQASLVSAQNEEADILAHVGSDVDTLHDAAVCPSVPAIGTGSGGPALSLLSACVSSLSQ